MESLYIGDVILVVNGEDFCNVIYDEVVRVLKCVGKEVDLIVKYVKEVMFYFYCIVELNVSMVINVCVNGDG